PLVPKLPPISGEMTRNLVNGMPSTNADSRNRWLCGDCVVAYSVYSSVTGSYEPIAARGSIGLLMVRWLYSSSSTTTSADRIACAVPSSSPHVQRALRLPG